MPNTSPIAAQSVRAPELLAPAGDWDSVRAAIENGADAIYFGLQEGFNARTKASNFRIEELHSLMAVLRRRGVRGYLALNTLVFDDELARVERAARQAIEAGIDAVLVQDLGLARLLGRLCPDMPLHASTQMTLCSAECIAEAESLGLRRVVLPRELSIEQIAAIRSQTSVELEVFVHGALCVSYSGQCLASLALGGRSANRGQCAQPCRLPYEALCKLPSPVCGRGARDEGGPIRYPLSPRDLAAHDRIEQLIASGVDALKIEGRLKPAEYVAGATRCYRMAIDAAMQSLLSLREKVRVRAINQETNSPHPLPLSQREMGEEGSAADLEVAFSRGFCRGWLDGIDHRTLVSGQSSTHRGSLLGHVVEVRAERVVVALAGPVRRGDGVVFEDPRGQASEQGGRIFEIFQHRRSLTEEASGGQVELAFQHGALDLEKIAPGQKVWKTSDPRAESRLRRSFSGEYARRRVAVDMTVDAAVGRPMRIEARSAVGVAAHVESPEPLSKALKHPISVEMLREQLGRLGKTPYELRHVDARIDGRPMIPLSELGKLRHALVRQLDAAASEPPHRLLAAGSALEMLQEESLPSPACRRGDNHSPASTIPRIHVLCRSIEQIAAALACGEKSLVVELSDGSQYAEAVHMARRGGALVRLASPRIHMPGESDVFEAMAQCRPDEVLVRNLAGVSFFRQAGLPMGADFSLNAVNRLAFRWLLNRGLDRVTPAYDLDRERLLELVAEMPQRWEVVVHRHAPLFHTQYCLYCRLLSQGTSRCDCGRPCRLGGLRLRDRRGAEHFVGADGQCRNTVYYGRAESFGDLLPELLRRGVRHFRVELLTETTESEVRRPILPFAIQPDREC